MTMPWALRGCRNASFQYGLSRLTWTGSMPRARIRVSVASMSVTMKLKWCGLAPRVARKRSRNAASGPPVGVSSSIFGPVANFSWPHQYPDELPP